MIKDFDRWNKAKKRTDQYGKETYFEKREIWWCVLGANIGHEQDGVGYLFQRPVIVLRKFSSDTCLIAPLTTAHHSHPLRLPVGVIGEKESYVILSQIRVVDVKRFIEKICIVDTAIFEKIRKTVKEML